MHGDSRATLKVKISAFASEVRKRIKEITALWPAIRRRALC